MTRVGNLLQHILISVMEYISFGNIKQHFLCQSKLYCITLGEVSYISKLVEFSCIFC